MVHYIRSIIPYFTVNAPQLAFIVSSVCRPRRLRWRSGCGDEINFWDKWLGGRGLKWAEKYRERLDPYQPLQGHLSELIDARPGEYVKVLDVGAGPVSSVGKVWKDRTLTLIAVDALAKDYQVLLRKHRIEPVVRTRFSEAETLTKHFAESSFDLVHSRNSLDHSIDPIRGIDQMLRVVKNGCYVYLEHLSNEGHAENYTGLHQWNFGEENGRFVVSTRARWKINVSAVFARRAEIRTDTRTDGRGKWVIVTMRKCGGAAFAPDPVTQTCGNNPPTRGVDRAGVAPSSDVAVPCARVVPHKK